eukprot:scaffold23503_cov35-Cyclotella_meneghiniana.AAC.1
MLVAYIASPRLIVTSQSISVIVVLLFPNTQQTEVTHGYRRASWLSNNSNNSNNKNLPQHIVISAVVVVVIGASSNIIVFRPTPHNIRSIRNNLSFAAIITTTE